MIKTFYISGPNGSRFITIPEAELGKNVRPGETAYNAPTNADASSHYFINGIVVPYTPNELASRNSPPSMGHVWEPGIGWVDSRSIEQVKSDCWDKIKVARDNAEFGGFEWNGMRFDSDMTSQTRIIGATQLAAIIGPAFSITWTLADNTTVDLSAEEMGQIGAALGLHVNTVHGKGRLLRDQITAAESIEELSEIAW